MVALNPWNGHEFFIIFENGISHYNLPSIYLHKVLGLLNEAIDHKVQEQNGLMNVDPNWQDDMWNEQTFTEISNSFNVLTANYGHAYW
jgi:hypothetical protein